MGTRRTDNRGMALVLALFALVVIGALVAGAFFVGRVEQVTGYNTVWASQAGEAAYRAVIGPLNAASGLQFRYLDRNQALLDPATANPADVRLIEVQGTTARR